MERNCIRCWTLLSGGMFRRSSKKWLCLRWPRAAQWYMICNGVLSVVSQSRQKGFGCLIESKKLLCVLKMKSRVSVAKQVPEGREIFSGCCLSVFSWPEPFLVPFFVENFIRDVKRVGTWINLSRPWAYTRPINVPITT
jgi:hypothetical protein